MAATHFAKKYRESLAKNRPAMQAKSFSASGFKIFQTINNLKVFFNRMEENECDENSCRGDRDFRLYTGCLVAKGTVSQSHFC